MSDNLPPRTPAPANPKGKGTPATNSAQGRGLKLTLNVGQLSSPGQLSRPAISPALANASSPSGSTPQVGRRQVGHGRPQVGHPRQGSTSGSTGQTAGEVQKWIMPFLPSINLLTHLFRCSFGKQLSSSKDPRFRQETGYQ